MSYSTMKAVVKTGKGQVAVKNLPKPTPGPGDLLIKVVAFAMNPLDFRAVWTRPNPEDGVGSIIGIDFSGTVEEIGSEVAAGSFKFGDRVAGFVHGGQDEHSVGAYAEYVVCSAEIPVVLPNDMSFEDGSVLVACAYTACLCLYNVLKLPTPIAPTKTKTPLLVWSGASVTGQYTIQLAAQAGLQVITTASPENFEFVKSLGAEAVFDYHDADVADQIVKYTDGKLKYAVDCISEWDSPEKVTKSIGPEGGIVSTIFHPYPHERKDVKVEISLVLALLSLQPFHYPAPYAPTPEEVGLRREYQKLITGLLHKGSFKTSPVKIMPGGLDGVAEGLVLLKDGKVKAQKLTYRVADTV